MAELIKSISEVCVADVEIGKRLRPVSEAGVSALIASINELGIMKDAVHIRKKKSGDLVLMAGAHRLTAARQLGWEMIEANVWKCTDDWAALMEIDDNLAGAELTVLDTAIFLAERKRVYEKLHPETKAQDGAALASRRWDATDMMSVACFASATAEKMGISERHVRRMVTAGSALSADHRRWLRAAQNPVTLADLQAISKVSDDHIRSQVCIDMANGTAKSAVDAMRRWSEKAPIKDPVEAAFKALRQAWARAPKEARRRFISAERREIDGMLQDVITDDLRDYVEGSDA